MKKIIWNLFLLGLLIHPCLSIRSAIYYIYPENERISQIQFDALEKTTVLRSQISPTGYVVTFRYKAPTAKRVRIYGEWLFSDISDATMVTSTNALPDQWKDGYVVWPTEEWPIADMKLNHFTGVWSYTIPLPCGTYNYQFYVDGKHYTRVNDLTDAMMVLDPANRPKLSHYNNVLDLSKEECLSSIYVPYDSNKQILSENRKEEAPRKDKNGKVSFVRLFNEDSINIDFGVYLPYNFRINRTEPYPVLILMHGGGGTEASWFNNGLVNILDNMIAEGRLKPTVVITPNGSDAHWNRPEILRRVIKKIIPYAETNYNISHDISKRAFGGLSMGGATTMYAFFHCAEQFLYYLDMSSPLTEDVIPDYTNPLLKERKLCITMGQYDFVKRAQDLIGKGMLPGQNRKKEKSIYNYIYGLKDAGIPFKTSIELPYGHTWSLWRANIVYMLDNILWK